MSSTTRASSKEGQEVQGITLSSGAGRLLFALLLSPQEVSRFDLSLLANVPRKLLPACIDEILSTELQSPDPDELPTATGATGKSIAQQPALDQEVQQNYLSPEEAIEAACQAADQAKDNKAQALALVEAWKSLFPEVNKVQELQPRKAKEWIREVSKVFPGQESSTVYGWMSGVDEGKLLSLDFPLAYVNKMILNKTKEQQSVTTPEPETSEEDEGVMDIWRNYAQKKILEQGVPQNVGKNRKTNLQRIADAVKGSTSQP